MKLIGPCRMLVLRQQWGAFKVLLRGDRRVRVCDMDSDFGWCVPGVWSVVCLSRLWGDLTLKRVLLMFVGGSFLGYSSPMWAFESLGRLFFAPEQRRMLDQQRRNSLREQTVRRDVGLQRIELNGYLLDNYGRQTTWINGRIYDEKMAREGGAHFLLSVSPTQPQTVIVDKRSQRIPLKVGQTLDLGTGVVDDPWDGRLKTYP